MTARLVLEDGWGDLLDDARYWLRWRWWRFVRGMSPRQFTVDFGGWERWGREHEALQALCDALGPPFWPSFSPCPLHPKNISTPTGPRCCYNPVFLVEDLSPVMECVTFSESTIKLKKSWED